MVYRPLEPALRVCAGVAAARAGVVFAGVLPLLGKLVEYFDDIKSPGEPIEEDVGE